LKNGLRTSVDRENLDLAKSWLKKSFRDDVPDCPPPLSFYGDFVVNISDIHIPFHNENYCELAIRYGYDFKKKNPTKKCVLNIVGDLVDFTAGYKFGHSEVDHSMRQSIRDAGYLLTAFAKVFDVIVYTKGNHDDRVSKKMDKLLGFPELVVLIRDAMESRCILDDNFLWSDYNYSIVNGSYMTVHPHNYSRLACTVPRKIAERHQISVITGHSHHAPSFVPTVCGRFVAIENGCLVQREKVGYTKDITTFPLHQNGFTILQVDNKGRTRFALVSDLSL